MGRILRRVAIALLCSLAAGFAFGTCVRLRAERPTVYIGAAGRNAEPSRPAAAYSSSTRSSSIAPVKAS